MDESLKIWVPIAIILIIGVIFILAATPLGDGVRTMITQTINQMTDKVNTGAGISVSDISLGSGV